MELLGLSLGLMGAIVSVVAILKGREKGHRVVLGVAVDGQVVAEVRVKTVGEAEQIGKALTARAQARGRDLAAVSPGAVPD
jgi:hypothetical protein